MTSVPIQRTQPVERKKILENITEEKDDKEEEVEAQAGRNEIRKNITEERDDSEEEKETEATGKEITKNITEEEDDREDEVTTGETRPKSGEKITFKVDGEKLQGIIKDVGKKSGKDANRCWVKFKGEEVRSFDFRDEVDSWKKVHSVNFCENSKDKENNQEIRKKERHMEEKGVRTMFYTRNNLEILEDEQKLNEVLVTEVPRKYHNSPEVIQATEMEFNNFQKFKAFDKVRTLAREE